MTTRLEEEEEDRAIKVGLGGVRAGHKHYIHKWHIEQFPGGWRRWGTKVCGPGIKKDRNEASRPHKYKKISKYKNYHMLMLLLLLPMENSRQESFLREG